MKKRKMLALIALVILIAVTLCGCQKKEPTLGEKIRQDKIELEEARKKLREAQQEQKMLEDALELYKRYQGN